MTRGRLNAAILAQILAQALTGWSMLVHVTRWPEVSIWALASLLAAALVPFRHDGSFRDRATGNFGSGVLLAGFFWWELIFDGLEGIIGGTGFALGVETMLTLAATVLFTVSGALFWTFREPDES